MKRSPAERPDLKSTEPPVVVQRSFDFSLWLIRKVEKFPRSFRFSVGDRVIARSLDLMETLTEAAYTANKSPLLERANRLVNALRLLVRLTVELNLLSGDSHEFASKSLEEIGRMIGGWIKATNQRPPQ